MGFDLTAESGDYFHFNWAGWTQILKEAWDYGWRPQGTLCPDWYIVGTDLRAADVYDKEKWEGGYFSNDGQVVTAEDACAIAQALERALPQLEQPKQRWVKDAIEFFRKGAFDIH